LPVMVGNTSTTTRLLDWARGCGCPLSLRERVRVRGNRWLLLSTAHPEPLPQGEGVAKSRCSTRTAGRKSAPVLVGTIKLCPPYDPACAVGWARLFVPTGTGHGLLPIRTRMLLGLCQVLLAFAVLVFNAAPIPAETGAGRFFLMGDWKIHIKSARTGREASVALLTPDGALNEEGLCAVDEVFGFPTKEKGEHISPRLLFMLDYFSDFAAPGKVINMESGYRSPEYNSTLRNAGGIVAKTSVHIDGMALDFSIAGVNGKELWNTIKNKDCCGIGNYGGSTVHLDSGKPRFWEAATSKVRTRESDYNRRIYLSTDFDRYKPGDAMRLSFSSVSDFRFGIKRTVAFVDNAEQSRTIATTEINTRDVSKTVLTSEGRDQESSDCVMINDRITSRFMDLTVPSDLREGRCRVRIDFCRRPFEQMPVSTISNEIELSSQAPRETAR
jgi:uncharacterized protein YcbK (DUF882 family)